MGRLEDKMAQVGGSAERVTTHMETRADVVLAREPQLKARADSFFDAKNAILDNAEQALDKAERALALLSNDPLPGPAASPESTPEVVPPPPFQP